MARGDFTLAPSRNRTCRLRNGHLLRYLAFLVGALLLHLEGDGVSVHLLGLGDGEKRAPTRDKAVVARIGSRLTMRPASLKHGRGTPLLPPLVLAIKFVHSVDHGDDVFDRSLRLYVMNRVENKSPAWREDFAPA